MWLYHITSDKFCIQGGVTASISSDSSITLTFKKSFKDTNFSMTLVPKRSSGITSGQGMLLFYPAANNKATIFNGQDTAYTACWTAHGYVS